MWMNALNIFNRFKPILISVVLVGTVNSIWAQEAGQNCPSPIPPLNERIAYIGNAPAKNAGFLWRIEQEGRTSWLYGTMHLNHIDWAKPGPQIMMALRQSDVLAVELNPYAPADPVVESNAPKISLTANQLEQLRQAYARECLPFDAQQINPASVTRPLLNAQAQRQGLLWGYGPDARLSQFAQRTQKPIVALETFNLQANALMPLSQAKFDLALAQFLKSIGTQEFQEGLFKMNLAWRNGDWASMLRLEQDLRKEDSESLERINDQRNTQMANKIEALHQEGKKVFVAVGVLHMTGPNALPDLLRAKGFSVETVSLQH